MADNTNQAGTDDIVTNEISHSGDTAKLQAVSLMGISGSEGSWTVDNINGDATFGLDTDVTRVIPGTSATALGKAIDSAVGATDTGVAFLGKRVTTPATITPANGDYAPVQLDDEGNLRVAVDEAIAGTTHDAAASTTGVMTHGIASATAPSAVTANDAVRQWRTLNGATMVVAALDSSSIYQAGTARTPGFGVIDVASSGDNTILAAQGSGNKIRVHSCFLVAASAVTVRFESGASGSALTGQMNVAANGGFVLPFNPAGWFETAANTLLNLELGGNVSVDGCFQYTVVT